VVLKAPPRTMPASARTVLATTQAGGESSASHLRSPRPVTPPLAELGEDAPAAFSFSPRADPGTYSPLDERSGASGASGSDPMGLSPRDGTPPGLTPRGQSPPGGVTPRDYSPPGGATPRGSSPPALTPRDGGSSPADLSPRDGGSSPADLSPRDGGSSPPDLSPRDGGSSPPAITPRDRSPPPGRTPRAGSMLDHISPAAMRPTRVTQVTAPIPTRPKPQQ
jgi:hypothetical protein